MVALRNGLRVRVVEAGPLTGQPVMLIHGWGACAYTFRYALSALAGDGKRVLSFDMRGHGLSDKPVGRLLYTTPTLLDDLRQLLDDCGLAQTDLVGHSLGGAIALRFAVAHPALVRRLVLAAPVGLTSVPLRRIARLLAPRFTERFARYLPPRWLTGFLLRGAYGDPRRVSEETIDQYWAPSQFPGYYRAVRTLLAKFAWDPVLPNELESLQSRTLVILGGSDRLIRDAESAARRIPLSTVLSIEGAGHLGVEECPTEFNQAIARFLNE